MLLSILLIPSANAPTRLAIASMNSPSLAATPLITPIKKSITITTNSSVCAASWLNTLRSRFTANVTICGNTLSNAVNELRINVKSVSITLSAEAKSASHIIATISVITVTTGS